MILSLLLSFLVLFPSFSHESTLEKEKVTIIIEHGKAYLVHVDETGKVLHKYMEIKGDLDTSSDLDTQVEKAKKEYLELIEREKDQIRFLAYDFLTDKVEPMAMTHVTDLVNHYNNSYANQIVITLGKRVGNEDFLKQKENLLVTALIDLGVPTQDIEVIYKWDRGPDPTEFIKVNTGLRKLPAT